MKKTLLLIFAVLCSLFSFSQIELGPDVEICASEFIIETEGTGTNYVWSLNGAIITGETLSYIVITQSGEYSIIVTIDGIDYDDSIMVTFIDSPIANQPSDYSVCDMNGNGIANIDLTIKDFEILNGLPQSEYYVLYYLTEAEAANQVNALASPYTNTFNPLTIYAVVISAVDNCMSNIVSFDVLINPSPVVYASEAFACDETGDGFASFNLDLYTTDFTQGNPNLTVTYYETLADAGAEVNPVTSPYTNNTAYSQVLYARVEDISTGCAATGQNGGLYLNVNNTLSVAPTPLIAPDPDNDGFTSFNLTDKDNEITGGSTNLFVTYFETMANADAAINALESPYTNIISNTQTVFARVEDLILSCVSFQELVLQTAPFIVNEAILEACDTDYNEVESFDLTAAEVTILDGLTVSDYSITYYEMYDDALSQINTILDPINYVNTVNPQVIYVGIEEIGTTNYVITTLTLIVNNLPIIDFTNELVLCDGQTLELNPNGDPNNTYLWSTNETSPSILITNSGEYFVSVTNPITGCVNEASVTIELGVLPAITTPDDLTTCDTLGVFDLTSVIPQMLNGIDPNAVTIGFYESQQGAEFNINQLANPEVYTATSVLQTIYINVSTNSGGCSVIVNFDLISQNCPTTIDCGTVETVEFCYENNEVQQYLFTSNDGSPLIVVFNSGMVENNWDELIVLDSDGTTNLNAGTPYGDEGDISNLTFQSTGDTITVFIQSDSSIISCTDNPINFDVFCYNDFVGIIEVNAFLDENNDGVYNNLDTPFTNGFFTYEINNDSNIETVNGTSGSFNIHSQDDANTYDITFNANTGYESCYTIPTTLFENVTVTGGNTVTVDFPVTEQSQCEDLAVYLIPSASPRPGFDYYNYLVIENEGFSAIDSGTVTFINDPQVSYLGAIYASSDVVITPNANGLTLDFVDLAPGETKSVWIEMNVPASINLGEFLTNTAIYTTAANDIVVDNNTSVLSQEVIGSYDPNDIAESHGPEIVYEDFITTNEYLYYTVRFQNIGTAEAINIRIENTIDPLLDISTLEVLHASHSEVLKVVDNQLTWYFDNINLPAESQDADGSNGYVYYKIKPIAGYSIGTIIPNTAEIYFDFNAAVITNTFNTEFVEPALSVEEFNIDNTFLMYPNPANAIVNIALSSPLNEAASIVVYDIQGKRLMDKVLSSNTLELQLNIEHLQSGLYFVKLKTNRTETIKRLVVK